MNVMRDVKAKHATYVDDVTSTRHTAEFFWTVIGAMKSGTGSLAKWLGGHPKGRASSLGRSARSGSRGTIPINLGANRWCLSQLQPLS